MRYLIDTNIFVYMATDGELLCNDVAEILQDYENTLYISTESVKELIIAYNNKGLCNKRWKTARDMVNSIENDFNIRISHIKKEHLLTYANLQVNNDYHKDPSDHLIIAHSITEKMPLISSDQRFPYYTEQGLDLIFNKR